MSLTVSIWAGKEVSDVAYRVVKYGVVMLVVCMLTLAPFYFRASVAAGSIIYVPDNFPTIQEAVDNAAPGSTIVVRDGFYREGILVDKDDLTIRSEHGPKNTIICYAEGKSEGYVVEIEGKGVTFEGFTLTYDGDVLVHGMMLRAAHNSIIRSNIIKTEHVNINTAIILETCLGVVIENNTLRETYHGIMLSRSDNCKIVGNLIIDMYGDGIRTEAHNSFNLIEGNDISSLGGYGIDLGSAWDTTIVGNVITGCQKAGINVASPTNTIYLNNFIANNKHIEIQMANTTWNSPPLDYIYDSKMHHGCLGNFWDDYKGVDSNHDGVGDTPYKISEAQYDRYPLMELIKFYKIVTSTTTTSSPTTTQPTKTTSSTPYTTSTTTSTTPVTSPPASSTQTATSPPQPPFEGLETAVIAVAAVAIIISLIVFLKVRRR